MDLTIDSEVLVSVVLLISGVLVAWILQATLVASRMADRGFDAVAWLVTSLVLGPASWPLALMEAYRGPPAPAVLRFGTMGPGVLDVFVGLHGNEVPDETRTQLRRVKPYCRRLVVARIVRAGGPTGVTKESRQFLLDVVDRLGIPEAELQLVYGEVGKVVEVLQERGDFGIILRSDRPDELFDGDGSRQSVRRLHEQSSAS